jgi:hypothetical protein
VDDDPAPCGLPRAPGRVRHFDDPTPVRRVLIEVLAEGVATAV